MTLRHIQIFRAVCENGCNSTRAAETMHMTQPAVSLAIKDLEQYYGVKLFERIGGRLSITEAGQRFWEYSTHISSLFDEMEKEIRDWDYFGVLRVGASITIGSQFLPNYVKAFYSRYPGTRIKVTVAPSGQLEEKLLSNELDVALIEGLAHHPSLSCEEYMEDQLVVICPADGEFQAGQKLTAEQFKNQKFLLREHGSGTREVFERVIEEANFSVSPEWEAVSTTALVNAVINGLGIAVLPYRMVSGVIRKGLVVPVTVEGLTFRRRFHIVKHKSKFLTSSAKDFLDLCRNYEADYPLPKYSGLY
ncbi:MAG: LysR family transcriptional regulator [Clostridia bacterium]|nr:LysR family transcriptional regulator [Clostridia bacterium]